MEVKKSLVYTAHSKHNFFATRIISAFVLRQDKIPLNPFMNWDYFLEDMVDREKVRQANNALVEISDELWQFGEISDGCYAEINLALESNKKVRFFRIGKTVEDIQEISPKDVVFEEGLATTILNTFAARLYGGHESQS